MSFRRSYFPWFSLSVLDDDSGDPLSGVRLAATNDCQRQLANHQLLAKPREFGVQVYYSTNPLAASPLMGAVTDQVQLDFMLYFPADFYAGYLPDLDAGSGRFLHLTNLDATGTPQIAATTSLSTGSSVAASDAVPLLPTRFEILMSIDAAATEVQAFRQFDPAELADVDVTRSGSEIPVEFDLSKFGAGRYRLATDTVPAQQTALLLSDELVAARAQGLVSVHLDQLQTLAPAVGYQFEARFEPR